MTYFHRFFWTIDGVLAGIDENQETGFCCDPKRRRQCNGQREPLVVTFALECSPLPPELPPLPPLTCLPLQNDLSDLQDRPRLQYHFYLLGLGGLIIVKMPNFALFSLTLNKGGVQKIKMEI